MARTYCKRTSTIVALSCLSLVFAGCVRLGFPEAPADGFSADQGGKPDAAAVDGIVTEDGIVAGDGIVTEDGIVAEDGIAEDGIAEDGEIPAVDLTSLDQTSVDHTTVDLPATDASKSLLGATCKVALDCASGFCADGRCCNNRCDDLCKSCDQANRLGSCAPIPGGQDPDLECKGSVAACKGSCNGAGACKWPTGVLCESVCLGSSGTPVTFKLNQKFCSAGACSTSVKVTDCGINNCAGAGIKATCRADGLCYSNADCIAASVCDRIEAHVSGKGHCVEPRKLLTVSPSDSVQVSANSALLSQRTHLKVQAGTYKSVALTGGELTIIGVGKTVLQSSVLDESVVSLAGATTALRLQGLTISRVKATSGALPPAGVACNGSSLTIVESLVAGNQGLGIEGNACDLQLRRTQITANGEGAMELTGGRIIAANNLLVVNGGQNASLGGASFVGTTGTFINNTIADNRCKSSAPGGIACTTVGLVVANGYISNNEGRAVVGCVPKTTLVLPFVGGISIKYKPTDPRAHNTGDNSLVDSKLDFHSGPRIRGGVVDLGAIEVK